MTESPQSPKHQDSENREDVFEKLSDLVVAVEDIDDDVIDDRQDVEGHIVLEDMQGTDDGFVEDKKYTDDDVIEDRQDVDDDNL